MPVQRSPSGVRSHNKVDSIVAPSVLPVIPLISSTLRFPERWER